MKSFEEIGLANKMIVDLPTPHTSLAYSFPNLTFTINMLYNKYSVISYVQGLDSSTLVCIANK